MCGGPDLAALDELPRPPVALVEAAQDAGVEDGAVLEAGVAQGVGLDHRAGHRLLEVQHRHSCRGHGTAELGMVLTAGADGDEVGALLLEHLPVVVVERLGTPALLEGRALLRQ